MIIDELLLISGNDIPFVQGQLIIHQPRLKEIAYITERRFWTGYEILKFDKESLSKNESEELSKFSNFQLILSLLAESQIEAQEARINVFSLLELLFPTSTIVIKRDYIQLQNSETKEIGRIDEKNFNIFLKILNDMFCLNTGSNKQYDPSGALAKRIAEQIKRGQRKRAQLGPKQEKVSFFSRYISILATAKNKSISEIMDYTIYQLMDEFSRYMLYKQNEQWFAMKIAGASGLKNPEDWLKDIHSQNNNFNKEETLI